MCAKKDEAYADIHEVDYRASYMRNRLQASGLLAIAGRKAELLNGEWHFMEDPYESSLRGHWYKEITTDADGRQLPSDFDPDDWGYMHVPSCWNMERPELYYYENLGMYMRTFRYTRHTEDERVFLHFEGAQYRAYVFLNGQCIGYHDGGSTPFTIEITKTVQKENRLFVSVDASRSHDRVPTENTDWFNYGGLYRDVMLIRTGKTLITDWFVRLRRNSGFKTIDVDMTVDGVSEGNAFLEIPELGVKQEITVKNGKGSGSFYAEPELWSPENPKLYEVKLSYEGDTLSDHIGFREIRVEGNNILLNGKERFLKGICVHEDHIDMGKCNTDENIREIIQNLKDLHGVFLRLAHYPHTRRFAQIADELGVMLWEEIPVYWAIDFTNPKTYEDAENQLSELIKRDRNRASVIIWSVGNENPDTDERLSFMSRLAKKAHELDETRCVSAACLVNMKKLKFEDRLMEHLDIIGQNEYYGWYTPNFEELLTILDNSQPTKPVIITEFGGGAAAGNHGPSDMMWTEEFQAEIYRKQFAVQKKCPFIKGSTPWIMIDFRAERRLNRYQKGYNRKGLISSDRKTKKLAFKVVSDYYKEIK